MYNQLITDNMFSNHRTERKKLPTTQAFTYLGKKISLSIIGNTLTFYTDPTISRLDVIALLAYSQQDSDLKHYNISNDDLEHDHYHLDSFDIKKRHYHQHFEKTLDISLLSKFLDYFVMINGMSEAEKDACLVIFANANQIPSQEFEEIMTNDCYYSFQRIMTAVYSKPLYEHISSLHNEILYDLNKMIAQMNKLPEIRRYINILKNIVLDPEKQEEADNIYDLIEPYSELWREIEPEHPNKILDFFRMANETLDSEDEKTRLRRS